ncbi:hypothetical protein QN277_014207 [Acacia crassicarpa]|uniref:Uncharacterized protein n=1 Tax=Acacia crassicarpa TaxID=499986 RepID=A0AAE1N4Y0_9FABA|nr:hypothetical protein QN277_014207 [Acacia crassicarpa]
MKLSVSDLHIRLESDPLSLSLCSSSSSHTFNQNPYSLARAMTNSRWNSGRVVYGSPDGNSTHSKKGPMR